MDLLTNDKRGMMEREAIKILRAGINLQTVVAGVETLELTLEEVGLISHLLLQEVEVGMLLEEVKILHHKLVVPGAKRQLQVQLEHQHHKKAMELGGTRMLELLNMMEEDGIESTSLDFHNYLKFICQDKLLDF